MTPSGIEPATFRFVTQHLNHCATAVPTIGVQAIKNHTRNIYKTFIQSGPKVGIDYTVYSIVVMVCIPTFDPPCILMLN